MNFDFEEEEEAEVIFGVKRHKCCETTATWVYYYALVAFCFPISLYRKYKLAVALRYKQAGYMLMLGLLLFITVLTYEILLIVCLIK